MHIGVWLFGNTHLQACKHYLSPHFSSPTLYYSLPPFCTPLLHSPMALFEVTLISLLHDFLSPFLTHLFSDTLLCITSPQCPSQFHSLWFGKACL
mmetsp:Transcript_118846/g.207015  ORF Transcript_118846/g.207015 Transcript_118846/m.207015 type:complete len:95 (-) Transcript_118846:72-356(-)